MLTLRYLDATPLIPGRIKIFRDSQKALDHLRDHVLTGPESFFWRLIVPQFRELFDPYDVNRMVRQFGKSLPEEAHGLYDGYCDAISEAVRDAIRLDWYWAERHSDGTQTWHAVGRTGVYVILDDRVVRTAHIRAYSAPPDRGGSKHKARHPTPRASNRDRKGKKEQPTSTPEDTPVARYKLFVKSWNLVRSAFGDACLHGRVVRGVGRMEFWRNQNLDIQAWIETQDPAAP